MRVTNAQSVSTTCRANRRCNVSDFAERYRAGRLIYSMLFVGVLFVLPTAPISAQEGLEYETIRFYTKNSRPERLLSSAMSPNGQYLAVSFENNLGSRSGASIIDLRNKRLVKEIGSYSLFALAFSGNSQQLLGIGNYAGTQLIQVASGSSHRYRNAPIAKGAMGISLKQENGKLLVKQVGEDRNPTIAGQIRVGDELLAVNEGANPDISRQYF